MTVTVHQLQLLQTIATVEQVDAFRLEGAYQALALTIGDRVIYLVDDGRILEYPFAGEPANWPTDQAARDRLRTQYPTLAARQGVTS